LAIVLGFQKSIGAWISVVDVRDNGEISNIFLFATMALYYKEAKEENQVISEELKNP
jgi:hypothetical protein